MKTQLQKKVIAATLALASITVSAQTTADFQNLVLSPNTYWNGSTSNASVSTTGTFTSGNCIFPNAWTGSFGGYWSKGWAYSNMKDSTTAGSGNQYSVRSAVGYANSSIYAIGQGGAVLKFNAAAQGKEMSGFYVNNSTYAALSVKNGDSFAKKFGGVSGNDADWFKLKIQKYFGGVLVPDSVTFYLADYRFSDNSKDYIVTTWQYIDLSGLGRADSLEFTLTSSDNTGGFMNTPNYFCLDNFTTRNDITGLAEVNTFENSTVVYPNPATSQLTIASQQAIKHMAVYTMTGQLVFQSETQSNDISHLSAGVYFVQITSDKGVMITKRIVKN